MLRSKSNKSSGGMLISVDGRGVPDAQPGGNQSFRSSNLLYRDSMVDADDVNRDSIFNHEKHAKKWFSWLPKKEICAFMDSMKYQAFIFLLVLYSLFAYNIAIMTHAPPSADPWINAFLILCIVIFASEIVLTVICNPRPIWMMVVLDTIATLSIIVDLSWVAEAANLEGTNGSRTSQAAVVSARAGRILRLVRLLRMLRTVSLLSKLANRAMQQRKAAEQGATSGGPSNIGGKLTDALITEVALVIIVTVIATALLSSWGVQPSPFDAYADSFGIQAGATREQLQPEVDGMLAFAKEHVPKQKPLTLRVGTVEWNWVEEAGGWPAQSSAAAEFASQGDKANPSALIVVDISDQDAEDALMDILLIIAVLLVLLIYVTALNVTIYTTLVRPLERIFNSIRTNAAQVVAALGNNADRNSEDDEDQLLSSSEDGDIATIEAAVEKMSRILKHATTPGQQGSHVARTLAADADNDTKDWLATMVGDAIREKAPETGAGGAGTSNTATPAAPGPGESSPGALPPVKHHSRGLRFSMLSNKSSESNAIAAAAAAAAASMSPAVGSSRLSANSLSCSSPPGDSRPATGSFGALTNHDTSFDALACLAAFGGGLTPLQKEALLSVDLEGLNSFKLDILSLSREELTPYVVTMFIQLGLARLSDVSPDEGSDSQDGDPMTPKPSLAQHAQQQGGFVDVARLWKFVDKVSTYYRDVPYHNLYHCVDVTHTTFLLLNRLRAPACLTPVECFSLMVAALAHDMDHPGVNNSYLVSVRDSLALVYNDASVLENRHVACLYALVTEHPELDVFKDLDTATWKEVRRLIIAAILHTDMTQHFPMVSKFEVFLELKAADIQAAHTAQKNALRNRGGTGGGQGSFPYASLFSATSGATGAYGPSPQLPSIFNTTEERTLMLSAILHCADISNPARPADIAAKWSDRVLAEFFAQGDRERAAGQPISPMCDRATTNKPTSQINFVEFVVAPLFSLVVRIFPDAAELMQNTAATRRYWQSALLEELGADSTKTQEERTAEMTKSEGRFAAFQDKYKEALAMASRRRREIRRRLNGVPSFANSEMQRVDSGWHGQSVAFSTLSSNPVGNSTRSSASSIAEVPRGMSGTLSAAASSPTAAAALAKPRPSLMGQSSEMARALANALVQRTRSASGRGSTLLESPKSAGTSSPKAPPPPPESDMV